MTHAGILSEYLERAMHRAVLVRLDDGSYAGRIPPCKGVLAFAETRKRCEAELRSVLEEWVVLGLRLRHRLPVLGRVDLNLERRGGRVATV